MENTQSNQRISFSKNVVSSPRNSALQNITNMSNTATFQRSTISTSKSKRQTINGQIQKSKIKTLPNHERYSMANNLPFITIFQTIEIERLSDQIETQRIKLKQYERQIFNSLNFQVQIKQLTERCAINENEINQYRVELDKMNKICETLYHQNQSIKNKLKNTDSVLKNRLQQQAKKNRQLIEEVQRWKNRYQITEQNKQSQVQQMISMMEKQRRSMIQRQLKDMKIRHEGQINQLTIQIRRMNQLVETKQRDIQQLVKKHQNSQDHIKQLKQYGYKINQYEDKIGFLSQEQLRLSRMVDVNTAQLDNARKKQFKLNQQLKTDRQLVIDNEHLRQLVEMKHKELQSCKVHIQELQQNITQNRQLVHINQQLSAKTNCLTKQIQKLNKLLKDRCVQIQKWKRTALQLQQDNIKYRQFEDVVIEYESKIKVVQAENERIEGINKVRGRQVQELKNKLISAQNQLINLSRLQKQKKNLQDKYKTQVERIMQLQLYIQKNEQQYNNLKQSENKLKSTQSIIQRLRKENQRQQIKLTQYEKQLANLKQYQTQLDKQNVKIKQTDTTVILCEDKLSLMSEEVQRLNAMLKTKNDEICKLEDEKIANFTITNQYKGLKSQLQENTRVINKLRHQNDQYQSKIYSYEQKMQEIDEKNKQIFLELNGNLKKLEQQAKKKTKQNQQLKSKEKKMKNELEDMEQMQKLNQKQQNRITIYLRDLQDLRNQNKQIGSHLHDEKRKNQDLQNELKKIRISSIQQEEIRKSTISKNQSRKSTQSNRTMISSLSSSVEPERLMTKIYNLEQIIDDLKNKYVELLNFANSNRSNININSQNSMKSSVQSY